MLLQLRPYVSGRLVANVATDIGGAQQPAGTRLPQTGAVDTVLASGRRHVEYPPKTVHVTYSSDNQSRRLREEVGMKMEVED